MAGPAGQPPATGSPAGGPRAGGPPPAGLPSARRLALTGAAFVLVPGLALSVLLGLAGVAVEGAGLAGLLVMVVGVVAFPFYLRRLGKALQGTREEPE